MRRLAGRPLIAYTLAAVVESGVVDRVVLSSEDEEILTWASLRGYEVAPRPHDLAVDAATIAEVALQVADELDWDGIVAVFQPTSPLRSSASIRMALEAFRSSGADSLMSVAREEHLFWYDELDDPQSATPLFASRVNRQLATHRVLRETGAIQLIRADRLRESKGMVAEKHYLFELPKGESHDIDTVDDLIVARRQLEQGSVVFRLRANRTVGSGHLQHCLQLAEELVDQRLAFLLVDCDPFVADLLEERGYAFRSETDLAVDLEALRGPGQNLVVNDLLDTAEKEILVERSLDFLVVNIEDGGPGTRLADWVVNALYQLDGASTNVVCGPKWATLRTEFHDLPEKEIRVRQPRILITFGGTDPGQLAPRFAGVLSEVLGSDIEIVVVVGLGAEQGDFPDRCLVRRHTRSMAAEMLAADLVLTAAGRTVYESAATGTPVVVVAQNAREATHAHLGYDSGVVFLGIGPLVDDTNVRVGRPPPPGRPHPPARAQPPTASVDRRAGRRTAGRPHTIAHEGTGVSMEVQVNGAPPLRSGTCRVVAEAGANHNNSIERAIDMARQAAAAGAWAVKYQLYKADRISVKESPKYWTDSIGTRTQHEAFRLSDHLDYDAYRTIAEACERFGIAFFATPFDADTVAALERIGAPIYKVASGDITHRPLLEAIAETKKPVMLSTGASTPEEIEDAIDWLGYGPERLVLLVCTLTYPTPDEDGNFARIETFRQRFAPYLIGMSDHTLGTAGGWLTAALGGVCIEKHYTVDKRLPDVPDHAMSVDPDELAALVAACDRGARLRGDDWIGVRASEEPARAYARRSIVMQRAVAAGEVLTPETIGFKRPGTGLAPSHVHEVVGRRARRPLEPDHFVQLDDLE